MSVENLKAKQAVVDEIKEKLSRAQSAIIIDYMGINVEEADAMRKQLREAGIDYSVYKNTLVKRAIEGTEFENLASVLSGPSAFAFGYEDAIAPAREINKVINSIKKMEFKAGIVEGQLLDKEGIIAIAKLPSREELVAKFLGSIKAPVSNLAYMLQAIADQKASGAPEPEVKPAEAEKAPEAAAPEAAPAEAEKAPAAAEPEAAPAEAEKAPEAAAEPEAAPAEAEAAPAAAEPEAAPAEAEAAAEPETPPAE